MKTLVVLSCLMLLLTLKILGQNQTLTVVVHHIKNDKGFIRVGLCKSAEEFQNKSLHAESINATKGDVELVFENIPPGTYALSVVHDTNNNGQMDTNAAGIPKEGFGFSNNVTGMFGPPKYEEAKFVWDGQKKIEITLKYF